MKRLLTIRSIKSNVRFLETELHKTIGKRMMNGWFWKRKNKITPAITLNGFEAISTCSVDIPLKGVIEIGYRDNHEKLGIMQVPSQTSFFVTCVKRNDGPYVLAIEASLS